VRSEGGEVVPTVIRRADRGRPTSVRSGQILAPLAGARISRAVGDPWPLAIPSQGGSVLYESS
jgi:hypothetical protein